MVKAPIFRTEGHLQMSEQFDELRRIADRLAADAPSGLITELRAAIQAAEDATRATRPIGRGATRVGYGVGKAQKAIACDQLIAIARQIKAIKGW